MYSHLFQFRFADSVEAADRLRFVAQLFDIPAQIGAHPTDIYWYRLHFNGRVDFYSNTLDVTASVELRLAEAEKQGLLTCERPGLSSDLTFLGRAVAGLSGALWRTLTKPFRKGGNDA